MTKQYFNIGITIFTHLTDNGRDVVIFLTSFNFWPYGFKVVNNFFAIFLVKLTNKCLYSWYIE